MTVNDRTPVYLDCDTGIDDVLAIAYILSRPEIEVVGIGTVSGNIDARSAADNTLRVLDLLGADPIAVASGQRDFLTHAYSGGAPEVHGVNGIGDVVLPASDRTLDDRDAVELLVDLAGRYAGRLRIIAIGPLTNLAKALAQAPELPASVRDVTLMGGAFLEPGNITPHAEANIYNDPEAADAVFAADWDITVLPVDAARQHRFEEPDLGSLKASEDAVVRTIGTMLETYGDFYEGVFGRRLAVLYDPLAAALLTDQVTVTRELRGPISVVTGDGPERGRTTAARDEDLRHGSTRRACRIVLAAEPPFAPLLDAAIRAVPVPSSSTSR